MRIPVCFPMLAWLLAGPPPPKPVKEDVELALRVLRMRSPETNWQTPGLRADVDGDGIADLSVLGRHEKWLSVVVIVGPIHSGSTMLSQAVGVDGGELTAECAAGATLSVETTVLPPEIEPVPQPRASRLGLMLAVRPCDVYHYYWTPERRAFSWWRE